MRPRFGTPSREESGTRRKRAFERSALHRSTPTLTATRLCRRAEMMGRRERGRIEVCRAAGKRMVQQLMIHTYSEVRNMNDTLIEPSQLM